MSVILFTKGVDYGRRGKGEETLLISQCLDLRLRASPYLAISSNLEPVLPPLLAAKLNSSIMPTAGMIYMFETSTYVDATSSATA
jgi:hypothetical protein